MLKILNKLCDKCWYFRESPAGESYGRDPKYVAKKMYFCILETSQHERKFLNFDKMMMESETGQKNYPKKVPNGCPYELEHLLAKEL